MCQSTCREQNYCESCSYEWYPRGHDISQRCPSCKSTSVAVYEDHTGNIVALLLLAVVTISLFWAPLNNAVEYIQPYLSETHQQH